MRVISLIAGMTLMFLAGILVMSKYYWASAPTALVGGICLGVSLHHAREAGEKNE